VLSRFRALPIRLSANSVRLYVRLPKHKFVDLGRTLGRLPVLPGTLRALLMHRCNHA